MKLLVVVIDWKLNRKKKVTEPLFLAQSWLSETFPRIRLTYLGDERWVLHVAVHITVFSNFTFESISLKESAQDCLLAEDLACDQITPACYGRLEDDNSVCILYVFCECKIQVGASMLPLICWQGPEDGNKRSSC